MKPLKVIFIEKDKDLFDTAHAFYGSVFARAGYDAEFIWAEGESAAHGQILKTWPHIVICDLGYDEQYAGLMVISNLCRDFPDLFFIGTSRGDYSPRDVQAKGVRLDIFIDKQNLFTAGQSSSNPSKRKNYPDRITEEFIRAFAVDTDVAIKNLEQLKSTYKSNAEQRELHSLLSQVMFTSHTPDDLMQPNDVWLHPMPGGFSGSSVYRLEARNRASGIQAVPAVLKVSERDSAAQELVNSPVATQTPPVMATSKSPSRR